ncbi:MAG: MFS transporter [Ruminococcaceae bacterium]|nr:MFS transporter [Oscillospiraceae bacterium]
MKKDSIPLWTRNFRLVTLATALGAAGGIAGGFALSFLVFDETGSTLASALIVAIQFVPSIFVPFLVAPVMDRLPRKAFLVGGDVCNGILYAGMGIWLVFFDFSYVGYLGLSVLLACLGSVDSLAYTSIYPELIPAGAEQKGYAVSSMLYPILKVVMAPLAAVLLDALGVPLLLLFQGGLSLAAALTESFIRVDESQRAPGERYTVSMWRADVGEGLAYLRKERGVRGIYEYMSVTNGLASGYAPILVAFFRTMPGMTAAMYALFSVAEFAGRTVGSAVQYKLDVPKKRQFGFVFLVYQTYELMDMLLLWVPYPFMLANRAVCGFLGNNSAILREAAVQRYIPERLRARVNALFDTMLTAACSICALAVGALGEVLDYRLCVTLCGAAAMLSCWLLIWGRRADVRKVYEADEADAAQSSCA